MRDILKFLIFAFCLGKIPAVVPSDANNGDPRTRDRDIKGTKDAHEKRHVPPTMDSMRHERHSHASMHRSLMNQLDELNLSYRNVLSQMNRPDLSDSEKNRMMKEREMLQMKMESVKRQLHFSMKHMRDDHMDHEHRRRAVEDMMKKQADQKMREMEMKRRRIRDAEL